MKFILSKLLGNLHRGLSRSKLAMFAVIKIENQCKAIIRSHLNDGIDPDRNGEHLLLSLVAPDSRIFIDVGANVGNWAKVFAKLMEDPIFGVLIEPSPVALTELNKAASTINCETLIVDAAAGEQQGESTFFAEPDSGETSSLVPGFSNIKAQEIIVRVTTIDHEISSREIEFVDFLKIDAEGFDLRVLMGAQNTLRTGDIGIVQFEYNSPWAQTSSTLFEAICMLENHGYEVFLLKRDGLYKLRYELYGEYFGYSNYVAVSKKYQEKVSALKRGSI